MGYMSLELSKVELHWTWEQELNQIVASSTVLVLLSHDLVKATIAVSLACGD
jgi:hypothetical protein